MPGSWPDGAWGSYPTESFRRFQSLVLDEYDQIVGEHDLRVIDATRSITEQQRVFRRVVSENLEVSL